jgi:hypothetical protein
MSWPLLARPMGLPPVPYGSATGIAAHASLLLAYEELEGRPNALT